MSTIFTICAFTLFFGFARIHYELLLLSKVIRDKAGEQGVSVGGVIGMLTIKQMKSIRIKDVDEELKRKNELAVKLWHLRYIVAILFLITFILISNQ